MVGETHVPDGGCVHAGGVRQPHGSRRERQPERAASRRPHRRWSGEGVGWCVLVCEPNRHSERELTFARSSKKWRSARGARARASRAMPRVPWRSWWRCASQARSARTPSSSRRRRMCTTWCALLLRGSLSLPHTPRTAAGSDALVRHGDTRSERTWERGRSPSRCDAEYRTTGVWIRSMRGASTGLQRARRVLGTLRASHAVRAHPSAASIGSSIRYTQWGLLHRSFDALRQCPSRKGLGARIFPVSTGRRMDPSQPRTLLMHRRDTLAPARAEPHLRTSIRFKIACAGGWTHHSG